MTNETTKEAARLDTTDAGLRAIAQQVRDSAPLLERLDECQKRIGKMCSERRGPKMSIPVNWQDDDEFICTTLRDAMNALAAPAPAQSEGKMPERAKPVAIIRADETDAASVWGTVHYKPNAADGFMLDTKTMHDVVLASDYDALWTALAEARRENEDKRRLYTGLEKYWSEIGATLTSSEDEDYREAAKRIVAALAAATARVAELEAGNANLLAQAQGHAQEARTANATIHEIYQCVSGATGEPGGWNGAEPVRRRIAELEAKLAASGEPAGWITESHGDRVRFTDKPKGFDCLLCAEGQRPVYAAPQPAGEAVRWTLTQERDVAVLRNLGGMTVSHHSIQSPAWAELRRLLGSDDRCTLLVSRVKA